jgi:hypothetical protein
MFTTRNCVSVTASRALAFKSPPCVARRALRDSTEVTGCALTTLHGPLSPGARSGAAAQIERLYVTPLFREASA